MRYEKRFLVSMLCVALLPAVAHAAFTASPMELHLGIEAGGRGATGVTICNRGDLPITLKLYLSDNQPLPDGTEEHMDPGTLARSCAPWVSLSDQVLELGPKEVRRTMIGIDVPEDADGTYWAKLYVEEISVPRPATADIQGRSYQVFATLRLGVRIFEDVADTENPGARITNVRIEKGDEGQPHVLVTVENTGNTRLLCTGKVEVRDSTGEAVETLPLGAPDGTFSVYPDGHRDVAASSGGDLPNGTYTALAIVDFGASHLVAGDNVFQITPSGLVPSFGASE